jgi:hypothetical protein
MGLMYSWATREYLLWNMTIGQIFLYRNNGIKIQNRINEKAPGLLDKSPKELRKLKEELKEMQELERQTTLKQQMQQKYGDV